MLFVMKDGENMANTSVSWIREQCYSQVKLVEYWFLFVKLSIPMTVYIFSVWIYHHRNSYDPFERQWLADLSL